MSDKPSALERLATARLTSDLTVDPTKRLDADYIIGAAIAQTRAGAVTGLLVNSRRSLRQALESVHDLVVKLNARRGWLLDDDQTKVVTKQALMHHVAPACPACKGRGYEVAEGAPALSGHICKPCRGSGKRPVQRKLNKEIIQVISVLETLDQLTEDAIRRLMR